jgi:hypothetical protein
MMIFRGQFSAKLYARHTPKTLYGMKPTSPVGRKQMDRRARTGTFSLALLVQYTPTPSANVYMARSTVSKAAGEGGTGSSA